MLWNEDFLKKTVRYLQICSYSESKHFFFQLSRFFSDNSHCILFNLMLFQWIVDLFFIKPTRKKMLVVSAAAQLTLAVVNATSLSTALCVFFKCNLILFQPHMMQYDKLCDDSRGQRVDTPVTPTDGITCSRRVVHFLVTQLHGTKGVGVKMRNQIWS